ncbi:MAG: ABC transporter substrate-binding protein [Candidatus Planktophila sp.]|nr:ABC transporter substrate-binding protein [Candidatus Planktophila sp.]
MSNISALRRAAVITAASALALSAVMVAGATSASAAVKPKTGGILTFLEHNPRLDHYDPSRIYTGRDLAFMNSFMTRTLVAYKPVPGAAGATLVADLATNTGIPSNAAKTWKFTLRPGSTFEDGKTITCTDVQYGVSRVFATDVITDGPGYLQAWLNIPKDADGNSVFKGPYKKDPAGLKAFKKAVSCSKDNRTITFKLNKSIADFNYLATYGVISPVQKKLDKGDKYDLRPQSTGPYKIAENSKTQLKLVRNSKWKKSSDPVRTPYPDEVVIMFGYDEEVIDQIILGDTIPTAVNFSEPLSTNNDKFFDDPKFKNRRMNNPDPYARYYAFNVKAMPCIEIRQAMYYSRNAKALLDYAGGETYAGSYATGVISPLLATDYAPTKVVGPGSPDFIPTGNIPKALALMETAKTKCPADYKKATETGLKIDVRSSVTLNDTIPIDTEAYARAGIKVTFNPIASGYYPTVMNPDKQSDLSISGWGADWANASTVIPELFASFGGFNISQNTSDPAYPAFEKGVNAAMLTTDRAKQAKMWKALDAQAMKNFWVLPTIFGKAQFVWGSQVRGVFFWVPQGNPAFGKMWVND